MMFSAYGSVATIFLIFFNVPYRKFLSKKLWEFAFLIIEFCKWLLYFGFIKNLELM
uniref:Uncharacterized protein n=1 Tax=Heterorhabditis bacteriophora TaxID=37862 RepID=A0A1I7WLV7_HETBA